MKKTSPQIGPALTGFIRRYGDTVFLSSLIFILGFAFLLFHQFVYAPVYRFTETTFRQQVFNTELYHRVIGNIDAREAAAGEHRAEVNRNPFKQ